MTTNRVNLRSFTFGGSAVAGAISADYRFSGDVSMLKDADTGNVDVIATTGGYYTLTVTFTKLPGIDRGDVGTPVLVGKSLDTDGTNGVGDGYQDGDVTMPTFGPGVVTEVGGGPVIDGDASYTVAIQGKLAA